MFRKSLVVLGCACCCPAVDAASFVIESFSHESGEEQLGYVNSLSKTPAKLEDVLHEYGYEGKSLPQSDVELSPYLEMYSRSGEYLLKCDGKFLAPIKAAMWQIRFSVILNSYPDDAIDKLKTFCKLIRPGGSDVKFKEFLVKVLFQRNGLRSLYSEIKEHEAKFTKGFFSPSLRVDFNAMLDIVDPDESIERFKK
jgi:hypothetical protein